MTSVTLTEARAIIDAAEKRAGEIGQPMNIAVVDSGGNLVSHARMDGAWIGSIDISIKKAWTSRAFDIATKDLAEHSQSGSQFFGIHGAGQIGPAEIINRLLGQKLQYGFYVFVFGHTHNNMQSIKMIIIQLAYYGFNAFFVVTGITKDIRSFAQLLPAAHQPGMAHHTGKSR